MCDSANLWYPVQLHEVRQVGIGFKLVTLLPNTLKVMHFRFKQFILDAAKNWPWVHILIFVIHKVPRLIDPVLGYIMFLLFCRCVYT